MSQHSLTYNNVRWLIMIDSDYEHEKRTRRPDGWISEGKARFLVPGCIS